MYKFQNWGRCRLSSLPSVFMALCISVCSAAELPSLSDAHIAPPNEDQVTRLVEMVQNLEALGDKYDVWLVDCTGILSNSEAKTKRVRVAEFRFLLAEDTSQGIRRCISTEHGVLDDDPTAGPVEPLGHGLIRSNRMIDLWIQKKNGEIATLFSDGQPARPLIDQTKPDHVLRRHIIFEPLGATLSSVAELRDTSSLRPMYGKFQAKLINGYGTLKGLEVGRWFYNRNESIGASRPPAGFGLIRTIAFDQGLPVVVEDHFGDPLTSDYKKHPPYYRTEIKWEKVEGVSSPVHIRARTGSGRNSPVEIDAQFRWQRGEAVPKDTFDPLSVGKFGFNVHRPEKN